MTMRVLHAPGLSARGFRAYCAAALIALSAMLPVFAAPAQNTPSVSLPSAGMPITRIAFGSCSKKSLPQPIWDAVLAAKPELFVFLGDNIYGDTRDMDVLWAKYANSPFLDSADDYKQWAERMGKAGREVPGPYARNPDPAATMLGERQWRWLEEQLRQPADVRVIGSSLQVLADFPGWEAWVNYPNDQQRLFRLIRDTDARGVFMISGDTHYGEFSRQGEHVPYALYDLTSSGLTEVWHAPVPNALRLDGQSFRQANFGMIEIDWSERAIDLSLRDVRGEPLLRKRLRLEELAMQRP